MFWMHKVCPEVLSNRWAENRKGITLRGSSVCQRLACPRVKAKSNFQEAEKGVSWPGLSSGQGRGLSPGDLKAGCGAQGVGLTLLWGSRLWRPVAIFCGWSLQLLGNCFDDGYPRWKSTAGSHPNSAARVTLAGGPGRNTVLRPT